MAKTANQRLRQLEKSGLSQSSQAYSYIVRLDFENKLEAGTVPYITNTKSGQLKFSTKMRDVDDKVLMDEYTKLQDFLRAKTSTVSGTKKNLEYSREQFNRKREKDGKIPWTPEQYKDVRLHEPLLDTYYNAYGSQEFNNMLSTGYSVGLDDVQISKVLYLVGLREGMEKAEAEAIGVMRNTYMKFDDWMQNRDRAGYSDSFFQNLNSPE